MVRFVQLRSLASLALQLAILGVLVAAFFVRFWQVSGPSMSPNVSSGELVVINTLAYRFGTPHRGDIVTFRHEGITPELYIKRVIGLPGDRVRIDRGVVYVNGIRLAEPYVQHADERSVPELTVPADSVYVLGDNRAVSEDSRVFGPVPESDLMGQALAGIWPVGSIGAL
ncbi:MAG TPA: signal peptidase I [Alphaproteobacteria bacterium]|nr:signal peptidase I [Alphaproteobacteria bacterium]